MEMAIKVDEKKSNATSCQTCTLVCQLFQWNKKAYCIQCYKTVVAEEYDTTTTFKKIFEATRTLPQWKRKCEGEPTLVLDMIEQYVDQYLQSAGFEMTCREFYAWKSNIDSQIMEEAKGRKKARNQTP